MLWFGGCFWQPCQWAWVQLRKKHRSRSCYFFSCSQIPRPCCPGGHYASRWPWFCSCQILCFWRPLCRAKANNFFHLLLQHFVGKKPAARVKKRPAAVLEADKPPASEAASVHSKEGSGSGEEKKPDHPEPAGGCCCHQRETKLGKRQLFQIRNPKKSHAQLKGILEKAKQKLLKGEPVEQVKLWAKEAAQ